MMEVTIPKKKKTNLEVDGGELLVLRRTLHT